MTGTRCEAPRQDGKPCGAFALKGGTRCFFHAPEAAEAHALAVVRGGEARRAFRGVDLAPPDLDSPRAVAAYLANRILPAILAGVLPPAVSNAATYTAAAAVNAYRIAASIGGPVPGDEKTLELVWPWQKAGGNKATNAEPIVIVDWRTPTGELTPEAAAEAQRAILDRANLASLDYAAPKPDPAAEAVRDRLRGTIRGKGNVGDDGL